MPSTDEKLGQIALTPAIHSVDDVIAVLRLLDGELRNEDGLKWFNLLYLKVSEGVRSQPQPIHWENAAWLERLDVQFAKLYFSAVADWFGNRPQVARSWLPLFESRNRRGILRVQLAFAGINAHINHDLPIALVQTGKEMRITPKRGTPEFRDFEKVNGVLEAAQENAKRYIATGIVGLIDEDLGQLDDRIANWSVRKARETAWSNGEILWRLNRATAVRDDFLVNLDRLVSLASRGFLVPVKTT